MKKEYIVTLSNYEDLDNFYIEMESNNGDFPIPNREVECALRRPISRNTHYFLTEEEAENLKKDPRVLYVSLLPSELGASPKSCWTQTGEFSKSPIFFNHNPNLKNWGLKRCTETTNAWTGTHLILDYGPDTITDTINTTSSGKNVDVVIVDDHINPSHPEFAVNPDGTGGSRVNQLDWFQYSSVLGYTSNGSYDYNYNGNHGTHVAGTAAGNTQGWARDANIYNITYNYTHAISSGAPNNHEIVTNDWVLYIFDYIRYFHKNKPINPITGRRNPTITNHSWGYYYDPYQLNPYDIDHIVYRGQTTSISLSTPSSELQSILTSVGIFAHVNTTGIVWVPFRYDALDADIADAIADGIIVVSAAGNSSFKINLPTDVDYNNYFITNKSGHTFSDPYYYARGQSPAATNNVICVGAVDAYAPEQKATFSNCGPRVDIFAPGTRIISSLYDSTSAISQYGYTLNSNIISDPRNSSYFIGYLQGTSMASPQVAGIIACLAEQWQRINQSLALSYLIENSIQNLLVEVDQGDSTIYSPPPEVGQNYRDLQGSPNRYLYYKKERPLNGQVQPNSTFNTRGSSSLKYPRRNTLF
jgi:hypothetical protein